MDPVARALTDAIKTDAEHAFYAAADWRPVWDPASAAELARAVAARRAHGLDRKAFAAAPTGSTREAQDVSLTRAALAYAGALARGAVNPKQLHSIYTLPGYAPDLAAELLAALRAGRLGDWLAGLAPQDAAYRALSDAYAQAASAPPPAPIVRTVCTTPSVTPPPAPPPPAPVPPLPDAPPATSGDAPVPAETPAPTPSIPVVAPPPAPTCVTVTEPAPARATPAALAVAMERRRWLARTPPATRIDVDVAAARLTYWRDGAVADTRVVVVGARDTKTPQIGSPMFRLVANPTWTIPASIVRKDKMAARSAASLARSGMAWKNGRIVQKPGPRNSLGVVKFDMRNGYAIYLHDTPAKGLFAAKARHRSHGCVRVSDAPGFAQMIADDAGVGDSWSRATARPATAFINLPREIPVRLIYATVSVVPGQAPVVRDDPYGWDMPIARRLGFAAAPRRPSATAAPVDEGP